MDSTLLAWYSPQGVAVAVDDDLFYIFSSTSKFTSIFEVHILNTLIASHHKSLYLCFSAW